MRKFKKILCAALASTMVLAMAAPSFAVEALPTGTGSITISSNEEGRTASRTYKVYQIFSLESYDGDNFAYKVTPEWETYIKNYKVEENGVEVNAFTLNADGYLMSDKLGDNNSDAAKAFAKDALAHAPAGSAYEVESTNGSANLDNIALGYYLIDSTVGTLCMLDTNAPNANVADKNIAPSLTKGFNDVVGTDGTSLENSASSDVKVGDTATYRIVVSAGDGAQNYVLTDSMTDALDLVTGTVKVYKVTNMSEEAARGEEFTADDSRAIVAGTDNSNYTLAETTHGFTITFTNTLTANWNSNDKIVVIYDAKVNSAAATGTLINNTAQLRYGDGEETPETPDTPSHTYQFDLQKVAQGTGANLTGAEFNLYDAETDGTLIQLVDITPNNAEPNTKVYRVAEENESGTTTTIEAGYAVVKGLDKDTTYYLQETVAPEGYNLLSTRKAVILEKDVTAALGAAAQERIENSTGTILPSTGGIGTTIFYAVGIILMAGAVFFVVRRKKA